MAAIKIGPWGGTGGIKWSCETHGRIAVIEIRYGDVIDSICFGFRATDSNAIQYSPWFGGNGGRHLKTITLNLDRGEYLKNISGTYRTVGEHIVVSSIAFSTNENYHDPLGNRSGTPFATPLNGEEITGFMGRYRDHIDAIGVYVKPSA